VIVFGTRQARWCAAALRMPNKFEARNPNIEIRNNFKTMNNKTNSMFQTGRTGIGVLNFPSLGLVWLRFVSVRGASFVLRISDFVSRHLGATNSLNVVLLNF
jgi:hypothetical protein